MHPIAVFVFIVCNVLFVAYCVYVLPSLMAGHSDLIIYGSAFSILGAGVLQLFSMVCANFVAPSGKFMKKNTITLPVKLAWWTMEQPAFIIPTMSLAMYVQSGRPVPPTALFLLLFMLHYFQRSFIYPWLTRGRPFPIWPNYGGAVLFCTLNGSGQANDLLYGNYSHYATMADLLHPRVFIGVGMFFFGFAANLHADYVLRNLRKPGEDSGYRVVLRMD